MGLLTKFEHLALELMLQGFSAHAIARKLEKDLEWAKQLEFPEKLATKPTKDEETEVRAAF